jgi:hypothetical protein
MVFRTCVADMITISLTHVSIRPRLIALSADWRLAPSDFEIESALRYRNPNQRGATPCTQGGATPDFIP